MYLKLSRTIRIALVMLFCIFLFHQESYATHAMGADLTYECIGPNQYRLTYSFYRDCASTVPAPTNPSITFSSSCFAGGTVSLTKIPGSPTRVVTTCPTALTTCDGGTYTGIEEHIYTGIVNLPGPCADWRFSFGHCCRNTAITTVPGASSYDLYVFSLLNNLDAPCNSSPTFSNKPVPFACIGQPFTFNHGANDVDGDSIVYQLVTPLDGATTPITYDFGYSSTQPVLSVPPVFFNPVSGDIRMQPTQSEVTVFAVLVSEYRNGILIGQVTRDIQLTVNNCLNVLPDIRGINGTPAFTRTICANEPFSFFIPSFDGDPTDTTHLSWDAGIPGGTFTTTGGVRDTGIFTWTPTTADISAAPQCFTVTVRDDECPYLGVQIKSFCLTVCGVVANAGPDQSAACGALVNLNGSATNSCGGTLSYQWLPNPWLPTGSTGEILNGVGVGDYYLEVTASGLGCKDVDTVSVTPGAGSVAANFNFTTNCSGLPVQFTDLSVGANSWGWDFGDGTTSTQQNPNHTFPANGTYDVTLVVGSAAGCSGTVTRQVVVNTNVPTATFNAPPVCQGFTSSLTDLSSGGPMNSWSWDFGDPASGASNTSSAQNPTHTFTSPGTYQVTLNVVNAAGCSSQVQQNVVVHANPVIAVADVSICLGEQAILNGPGGFAQYTWSNGANTQVLNVSPVSTSNYTLTVRDNNGCEGSDGATVTVNPLPAADAGTDQTICEGSSANLSGLGAGGGGSYNWNPGNLSGQNVTVSPLVTTDYTVTTTDINGCTNTDVLRINVNAMPQVSAGDDSDICKGDSITITAVSGVGNFIWNPGGYNTNSIRVSPASTTTYTVTVSDAIGCDGTDQIEIQVNPLPVASFSSSAPECVGEQVAFTDASNITSGAVTGWYWDFGDGQTSNLQNPTPVFSSSGGFNVFLRVSSNAGCRDSTTSAITINPLPVANAGPDESICPGFSATLNGGGGLQYLWSPGGFNTASINVNPASTTVYTLEVTDANGCVNTDQVHVVVHPAPIASAGLDRDICFGESTTLIATGLGNYTWTPGNITSANYTITPASTTTYNVRVVNSFGCEDSDEVTVNVNPLPVSSFNGSGPVCQNSNVSFTDMSSVTSGVITSWAWDLGNGVQSTVQNPSLNYTNAGTFNVNLIVTTDRGCKDTSNSLLTIWAEPVASFTNTNVCEGIPIQFTNTSSISDASPLTYTWDLGDGTPSSATSPNHLYASYGTYLAVLNVRSNNGCENNISRIVSVFAIPSADFAFDPACEDNAAQFNDRSTVPDGFVSSWIWSFGDGDMSNMPSPAHVYSDPGHYPIHLAIASNHGCRDSISSMIRIIPRPVSDFSTENDCEGIPVQLSDLSYPITGSIVQYIWSFGDGNTSTEQNPEHLYTSPGWYEVALTVISDSGCVTTLTRPNALQIYDAPDAHFTSNANLASDIYPIVNFENVTGSPGYYYWDFGDGTSSQQYSPTHTYPGIGVYDVQLVSIDLNGCIDSVLYRIEIRSTSTVYIPNSFTPNGDRKNDEFRIYTTNVVWLEAQIYDRWGLKVYEWDSLDGGWDGVVKGNPVQADVYVYRVQTVDVNNNRETRIGHVSLVR